MLNKKPARATMEILIAVNLVSFLIFQPLAQVFAADATILAPDTQTFAKDDAGTASSFILEDILPEDSSGKDSVSDKAIPTLPDGADDYLDEEDDKGMQKPDKPDESTDTSADRNEQSQSATLATVVASPLPTVSTNSTIKTLKPNIDEMSGALSYKVPIAVPPGRNGLQPDLSLSYNSQNREDGSVFGYGWSISIPSITRVNKTGSQVMYNLPNFTSTIDGELVQSSWGYYYAKSDGGTFNEYVPSGDSWVMRDKQGTVYTFGGTQNARQDNPTDATQTYQYMLSEIRDRNDNFISFSYYKNNGQIYPSSITYTGHGSTPGIFEISFVRQARPDVRKNYHSAFLVQTNERVSQIITKVNGATARTYTLCYTAGQDGTRSMLASITESGTDESGNTVTLPPTTFTYQTQAARTSALNLSWAAPFHVTAPSSGVLVFDANSDGLPDLLRSRQYPSPQPLEQDALLNTGSGWVSSPLWLPPPFPFATFNGSVVNPVGQPSKRRYPYGHISFCFCL
jgi:hypothetical protein